MNEVVAVGIKTKIEMIAMKENKVKVCLEAVERAKVLLKRQQDNLRGARKELRFWQRMKVE